MFCARWYYQLVNVYLNDSKKDQFMIQLVKFESKRDREVPENKLQTVL